ncbi:MAG: hypothetical protein J2P43_13645 [Candidatus Dormibacteraeota bacterium]|nr:hypothetical protein [Candidatus Dormibacteraeota bacterium]
MLLLGVVCLAGALGVPRAEAATGPDTWQLLGGMPATLRNPVQALAVDPGNHLVVLAGTQDGSVYRSTDGGAHWTRTGKRMGHTITALTFNPGAAGQVLAGTGGAGIWISTNDGAGWQPTPSTRHQWVRAITASNGVFAAGTHEGVLLSTDGSTWSSAGLKQVDVSALTIVSGGAEPSVVAGGDGERSGQALPLFVTQNGGHTWTSVAGTVSGSTMVSSLLTLPVKVGDTSPTIILGTNGGLFQSTDGGAQWSPDNGGGALPPVDVTSLATGNGNGQAYYVASDGGASSSGGLWVTRDGGNTFSSLAAPQPSVTALAVVPGANPLVYSASFRPIDHAVTFWAYSDIGGIPQGPAQAVATPAPSAVAPQTNPTVDWVRTLSHGPETPFLVFSAFAVLLLLVALAAYARSARRRF